MSEPALLALPVPRIRGVGLLTGWGEGAGALPTAVPQPPAALLPVATPSLAGTRFRRATRECLLAVAAVRVAARDAGITEPELAGERTGVLYVTATGYASANRAFLEDEGSTTLHFPYTAPSAVPGEVTIEFGIRGPYVTVTGGGPAALAALWYAARWLAERRAERVLVLSVEAVQEVWDLLGPARRLHRHPIVEGAVCLLLESGDGPALRWGSATAWSGDGADAASRVLDAMLEPGTPACVVSGTTRLERAERAALARHGCAAPLRRLPGEALASAPLIGLAEARARGEVGPVLLTATWRNEYGAMLWSLGGTPGGGT